jgi:uncharacterized Zn finger protein
MWGPYVSAAEKRRKAEREAEKRKKRGEQLSPVVVPARGGIATTFWGQAWCRNLERYSDFANRLPRGRSYVRNGSVIDLKIASREIHALVSGSDLYEVDIAVTPVSKDRWQAICKDCAGGIDSLVELLQGKFSKAVMERICRQGTGLFPSPREIRLACSCPDGAYMCKHVAAVLYGVGARLDREPELLFRLHEVKQEELIARAGEMPLGSKAPAKSRIVAAQDLSALFGVDLGEVPATPAGDSLPTSPRKRRPRTGRRPSRAPNRNSHRD